ncbi:hypothetical protein BsWGS_01861 [Bradybaena similaris]
MASSDDVSEMQIDKCRKQIGCNSLETENVLMTEGHGIHGEFIFADIFRCLRCPLLCGQFHTVIYPTALPKHSSDFCTLSRAVFESVRKEDVNIDITNSESAKQELRIVEIKHLGATKQESAVDELIHSEVIKPKFDTGEIRYLDKTQQESEINDIAHKVAAKTKLDINEITLSKTTEQSLDMSKIRHLGTRKQELYIDEIIQLEVIKQDVGTDKKTQPEATKQESSFDGIIHTGKLKGELGIETTQRKATELDLSIDESTQRKVTKLDLSIAESFDTLQMDFNLEHSVNITCRAEQPNYAKPNKSYDDSGKMHTRSGETILKPQSQDTEKESSTTLQKQGAGCVEECSRSQVKVMCEMFSSATTESVQTARPSFSIAIHQSQDTEINQTRQNALKTIAKPHQLTSSSRYTHVCRHEIQRTSVTKPNCRVQYKCPQAERRNNCTQGTRQWARESSVQIISVPGRTIGYRVVSSKEQETSNLLSGRIPKADRNPGIDNILQIQRAND